MLCPSGAESDPGRGTATAATTKQTSFSQRSRDFHPFWAITNVFASGSLHGQQVLVIKLDHSYTEHKCSNTTQNNKYVLLIFSYRESVHKVWDPSTWMCQMPGITSI